MRMKAGEGGEEKRREEKERKKERLTESNQETDRWWEVSDVMLLRFVITEECECSILWLLLLQIHFHRHNCISLVFLCLSGDIVA